MVATFDDSTVRETEECLSFVYLFNFIVWHLSSFCWTWIDTTTVRSSWWLTLRFHHTYLWARANTFIHRSCLSLARSLAVSRNEVARRWWRKSEKNTERKSNSVLLCLEVVWHVFRAIVLTKVRFVLKDDQDTCPWRRTDHCLNLDVCRKEENNDWNKISLVYTFQKRIQWMNRFHLLIWLGLAHCCRWRRRRRRIQRISNRMDGRAKGSQCLPSCRSFKFAFSADQGSDWIISAPFFPYTHASYRSLIDLKRMDWRRCVCMR